MKIYFEQKGGIAGISRHTVIDASLLSSPEELDQLRSMIDKSNFFELPSKTATPKQGAADYFEYTITLKTDDGRTHTVETTDLTKPPELNMLITYLKKKI